MTKRFTIPEPPLGDIVKSWFLKDLGEKWRNYKCSLKQKYFDEAFTPQYVKNNAPTDVNLEQFCKLVDFWYSDAGRHRSHAGKQNRSLQTTVHTAGSKSFARYAHELEKEKQVPINRADLYKAVHMRSDGSPINPDVAEKIRRMEEIGLNDSGSSQTSNEFRVDGSIGWSPSDRYAQVIGPERHGRIRGVGLGPTPSSHPANTNAAPSTIALSMEPLSGIFLTAGLRSFGRTETIFQLRAHPSLSDGFLRDTVQSSTSLSRTRMSLSADLRPQAQRKNVPFLVRIYSQTQSKGQCRVQHRHNLFLPVLVGTCLEEHNACTSSTVLSGVTTAGELLQQSLGWASWQLHQAVVNHTDKVILDWLHSWLQSPKVYQLARLFDRYSVMMGSSPRFNIVWE
ncbi:hypothetical protein CJ030_MR3G017011 [Morella rubra]|uniref:Uncharacterized protein n=1 Tax=Morella rubra TaxID=262757 RepID=A0A6A1W7Y2_9ROSI|nr:hypothetical protein CJ030_MR3G017011 [Morella rubra]